MWEIAYVLCVYMCLLWTALSQYQPCVTTNAQAYLSELYTCSQPLMNTTGLTGPNPDYTAVCKCVLRSYIILWFVET